MPEPQTSLWLVREEKPRRARFDGALAIGDRSPAWPVPPTSSAPGWLSPRGRATVRCLIAGTVDTAPMRVQSCAWSTS